LLQNKEIKLFNAIENMMLDLTASYDSNRYEHKMIALSFFIFAFF
jgi:hypothetical protein